MLGVAFCLILALVVVRISHLLYRWSNPKCNGKLPPGSMGFPIIGETLEFFTPHGLYDNPPFIRKRIDRYGHLFRTSLVGQKLIVSTDPEINYKIFLQENRSFELCYTESFNEIFGRDGLITYHGKAHRYLRNLILRLIGPENLRAQLLNEMYETTRRHLHSRAIHGSIDVKEVASDLIFEYFSKRLMSYDETKYRKKLKESYKAFMEGLLSFPLNIPGTAFHSCLKGRKRALKVITDIYEERIASKVPHHDFLDHLLEEVENEDTILNGSIVIHLIFVFLFVTQETASSTITLLIKYISDHPDVLTELQKEHEAILRSRGTQNSGGITWEEYKSMTLTHMVINETVRLANFVPGIFRKVVRDVEISGYTIPAGWLVMVVPSVLHFNPDIYENPLAFNPWRWKQTHELLEYMQGQELHAGSKTFMAFGGGVRLCAGADFAKLQTAVFIHYLVTNYRWSVTKGGDVIKNPGLTFPNGLHLEIAEKLKRSEDLNGKKK